MLVKVVTGMRTAIINPKEGVVAKFSGRVPGPLASLTVNISAARSASSSHLMACALGDSWRFEPTGCSVCSRLLSV